LPPTRVDAGVNVRFALLRSFKFQNDLSKSPVQFAGNTRSIHVNFERCTAPPSPSSSDATKALRNRLKSAEVDMDCGDL